MNEIENNDKKILYFCNGKKPMCKKSRCYLNGGECKRTTDVNYAINFEKKVYKNFDADNIDIKDEYFLEISPLENI